MRKTIATIAGAVLALGLTAGPSSAEPTTTTVTEYGVDTSESTGTGTSRFLDDGVFVRTRDGASEAAGYYSINKPLAEVSSVSQDWSGTAEPGIRLRLDIDGDGAADGTLTYESVYGGNLWASASSTQEFRNLAPHIAPGNGNNEGQGSQWYGTLAEWQTYLTGAEVVRGGWLLGLQGRGTLVSQTFGDATYTFASNPTAKPRVIASFKQPRDRVVKVRTGSVQPDGTVQNARGSFYRVVKFNPRTDRQRTVATGRVAEGDQDRLTVRFPKAKKKMQVRVISYGEVVAKRTVRMG